MENKALFDAIDAGDIKLINRMVSTDTALFKVHTDWGGNLLHLAAEAGQIEIMKLFILHGVDVNARDDDGETPLFCGVESLNYREVVQLLIENHADINAIDKLGQTILHNLAADGTDEAQVNFLVNLGANVNQKDKRGATPLHLAAMSGMESHVRILIENGAEVNVRSNGGSIPLHYSVYGNIMRNQVDRYLKTTEQLILLGADITAKTNDGQTPLDLAKLHVGYPIADLLISYGAK